MSRCARTWARGLLLLIAAVHPAGDAAAQGEPCVPAWLPKFAPLPGVNGELRALAVHDAGNGPVVCAGGWFSMAGGALGYSLAQWDGSAWQAPDVTANGPIRALAFFDDGSGPALYAGGEFDFAGGVHTGAIAKWDGSQWSALITGIQGRVDALVVHDDGSGPMLYVGGLFTTAGGVDVLNIARWDGTYWRGLGQGIDGDVDALAVFDDGSGPVLCAGGRFDTAGSVTAHNIARWDGAAWSALGDGTDADVLALASWNDGHGPALYAGGTFGVAGGIEASCIARWDGTSWSALGSGIGGGGPNPAVHALAVYDDGRGPALAAGGDFTLAGGAPASHVASWSGTGWSALGSGVLDTWGHPDVEALAVYDDGGGPRLCAAGYFLIAGGHAAASFALWDGEDWSATSNGLNGYVQELGVYDDGSGAALYVAGEFSMIGDVAANGFAKWDGKRWSPIPLLPRGYIDALAVYDDGTGPALYVGGYFQPGDWGQATALARWDGSNWSSVGGGFGDEYPSVDALAVYDDGSGPALYAGGRFSSAGGVAAECMARWDGSRWSALGSGLAGVDPHVHALHVHDAGSGPMLVVGGSFSSAGGVPVDNVAAWNGAFWSTLDVQNLQHVFALASFDDGSGPALFVAAISDWASDESYVTKWDGTDWTLLGEDYWGIKFSDTIFSLAVYDDGTGPALYAGGYFIAAGKAPAKGVAKWYGKAWSGVGGGISFGVRSLAVYDDGAGPALYVGSLGLAYDSADGYLAAWGCPSAPSPWTDLGGALPGVLGPPLLAGSGPLTPGSAGAFSLTAAAPSEISFLVASHAATPTPFKCGTLIASPIEAVYVLATDARGQAFAPWIGMPAGLSGVSLTFQGITHDAAAVCGVSLSNALLALPP